MQPLKTSRCFLSLLLIVACHSMVQGQGFLAEMGMMSEAESMADSSMDSSSSWSKDGDSWPLNTADGDDPLSWTCIGCLPLSTAYGSDHAPSSSSDRGSLPMSKTISGFSLKSVTPKSSKRQPYKTAMPLQSAASFPFQNTQNPDYPRRTFISFKGSKDSLTDTYSIAPFKARKKSSMISEPKYSSKRHRTNKNPPYYEYSLVSGDDLKHGRNDIDNSDYVGKCNPLTQPLHAKVDCKSNKIRVKCSVSCNDGYSFLDNVKINRNKCLHSVGTWIPTNNFPACEQTATTR